MLDETLQKDLIAAGREFTRGYRDSDPYEEAFESDQSLKRPQPPLVREPVSPPDHRIPLTRDFSGLKLKNDLLSLIRDRRSARVYTRAQLTGGEGSPEEQLFRLQQSFNKLFI